MDSAKQDITLRLPIQLLVRAIQYQKPIYQKKYYFGF